MQDHGRTENDKRNEKKEGGTVYLDFWYALYPRYATIPRTKTRPRMVPAKGSCAVKLPIISNVLPVALYAVEFTVIAELVWRLASKIATMITVTSATATPTAIITN